MNLLVIETAKATMSLSHHHLPDLPGVHPVLVRGREGS